MKDTMQKLEPRLCDSPSQVPFRKSTHNEIRDVVGRFFVSFNSSGAESSTHVAQRILLVSSRLV